MGPMLYLILMGCSRLLFMTSKKNIVAARDRLGVKPLFFYEGQDGSMFALKLLQFAICSMTMRLMKLTAPAMASTRML